MYLFTKFINIFLNLKNKSCFAGLFLWICLSGVCAQAVEVAFFRQYTPSGELVRYDGGEFAHIAISYRGQWLHAHPYGGVQLSENLEKIGMLDYVVLQNPRYPEPSLEFVQGEFRKEFDVLASWKDQGRTYCSKLVGMFFGIPPQKMSFASKDWQNIVTPKGQLGLSPDDVYEHLLAKKGFKPKILQHFTGQTRPLRASAEASKALCSGFLQATL